MAKSKKALVKALLEAAKEGDIDEVNSLLKDDAPVDEVGPGGYTPMSQAAEAGHYEIVDRLLKAGGDPTVEGPKGPGTPLHAAAEHGHAHVVNLLVEQEGVDVDAPRKSDGETPLTAAARAGQLQAAEQLIEAGADVDEPNENGITPYEAGRETTQLPVLALLRKAGADTGKEEEVEPEPEPEGVQEEDIVTHPSFGKGVVKAVRGFGENQKLDIDFEEHGEKTLLARFVEISERASAVQ